MTLVATLGWALPAPSPVLPTALQGNLYFKGEETEAQTLLLLVQRPVGGLEQDPQRADSTHPASRVSRVLLQVVTLQLGSSPRH